MKISSYKRDHRKINIEIDPSDVWSMDSTLSLIILPLLLEYKEQMSLHGGVPSDCLVDVGGDPNDSQLSFVFYTETYQDGVELGAIAWEEIIDKMIWAFQQIALTDYESKYHTLVNPAPPAKSPTTTLKDSFENYTKRYDYDHAGRVLHDERIQEGLNLFGKYFRALWN